MNTHKSKIPLAGGAVAKQSTEASIVADRSSENKALITVIARLALLGHSVHKLAAGGFLVVRWGMSRRCQDAASLTAFLAQVADHQ